MDFSTVVFDILGFGLVFFIGLVLAVLLGCLVYGSICFCCCCNNENHDEENGGSVLPISTNKNVVKMTEEESKAPCSICLDTLKARELKVAVLRNCNHKFHYPCIVDWTCRNRSCPLCRSAICQVDVAKIKIIEIV